MKTKFRFLQACMCMMLALALVSCSEGMPEFARLISKDAPLVMRVHVKQLAEKTGQQKDSRLTAQLKQGLERQGLSAEALQKLKTIIDDPAEAGVDLREPLLFFVDDMVRQSGGVVGALHDSDKFGELLKVMAAEGGTALPRAEGDLQVMYLNGALLAYDADCFFLFFEKGASEQTVWAYVKQRFAATDEESLRSREDFEQMCQSGSDMQLLLSGRMLDQLSSDRNVARMLTMMPPGLKAADLSTLFDLNSEPGGLTLTVQAIALTDAAKAYQQKYMDTFGKVSGKLLAYVPESAFYTMAVNVDGAKLYEQLKPELEQSRDVDAEMLQTIKQLLGSLSGDVVLALNNVSLRDEDMNFFCLAEVKDNETLNTLVTKLGQGRMTEEAPGQYSYRDRLFLGVKDGVLYVSTPQSFTVMEKAGKPLEAGKLTGNPVLMVLNIKALMHLEPMRRAASYADSSTRAALQLAGMCDRVEMTAGHDGKAVIRLRLKNEKVNPLELLAQEAERHIN